MAKKGMDELARLSALQEGQRQGYPQSYHEPAALRRVREDRSREPAPLPAEGGLGP
jgi:hypothetical protein